MQKSNFLKSHAFVNRIPADRLAPGSKANVLPNGRRNSIRPDSPDSDFSDEGAKLTKDQHICIQNVGMATAFFMPLALVGAAVAIATNYWFNMAGDYVGLFRYCNNWTSDCSSISDKYANDSRMEQIWKIGVPLELAGVALLGAGMMCLVCYPCHRKVNFSKLACAVVIGIVILLGMLTFVGGSIAFLVFYLDRKPDLAWSFYVNMAAAGVAFIATILFWVHIFYTACFDMD